MALLAQQAEFPLSDLDIKIAGNKIYIMFPGMQIGVLEVVEGKVATNLLVSKLLKIKNLKRTLSRVAPSLMGLYNNTNFMKLMNDLNEI